MTPSTKASLDGCYCIQQRPYSKLPFQWRSLFLFPKHWLRSIWKNVMRNFFQRIYCDTKKTNVALCFLSLSLAEVWPSFARQYSVFFSFICCFSFLLWVIYFFLYLLSIHNQTDQFEGVGFQRVPSFKDVANTTKPWRFLFDLPLTWSSLLHIYYGRFTSIVYQKESWTFRTVGTELLLVISDKKRN